MEMCVCIRETCYYGEKGYLEFGPNEIKQVMWYYGFTCESSIIVEVESILTSLAKLFKLVVI